MKILSGRGIDPKWQKSWKAISKDGLDWYKHQLPYATQELEDYVAGKNPPLFKQLRKDPSSGVTQRWQVFVATNLGTFAALNLFRLEYRAEVEGVFDAQSAVNVFAAAYTEQIVDYWINAKYVRLTGKQREFIDWSGVLYLALGVVMGFAEQTFKLAPLKLADYKANPISCLGPGPVYHFVFSLLADFLNESPPPSNTDFDREPALTDLLKEWRNPDPDRIAPLCVAACDLHTWYCKPATDHSIDGGMWTRFPIEIMLVFKLRSLLGLDNPELDHPLMNSPLAKLPENITCVPDDLIRRVRERMQIDGYDEEKILSEFHAGAR